VYGAGRSGGQNSQKDEEKDLSGAFSDWLCWFLLLFTAGDA